MRGVEDLANKHSPIFPAGFKELTIKVLTEETQEFCASDVAASLPRHVATSSPSHVAAQSRLYLLPPARHLI
jgi:hypothetical protein